MAEAFKKLAQGYLPVVGDGSASAIKLYDVPSSTEAIIKSINLTNSTGTAREATLYNTANGEDAADAEQMILPGVSIVAGGFAEWEGTMCLAATTELHGFAAAGSAITYTIWGIEIS
jgi:hypothetical protein